MRNIKEIIIHCSATEAYADFKAADIDRWHRQRGFRQIGYHYVVRLDGTVENGRPEDMFGAHCLGHNRNSIGICYIGGLENGAPADTRTDAQRVALQTLVGRLKARFPGVKVHGHRDFAAKECPCFDAYKEYADE